MGPYLCSAASLSSSHNLTAGRIVASVWWTPSKWAVGRSVGPGVLDRRLDCLKLVLASV